MELYAGNLTLNYEAGALRYIRIGATELLRSISLAVRDTKWGTLTPVITGLQIDDGPDYFFLSFHCRYEFGPIRWMGYVQAEGRNDNSISFEVHLTSRGEFRHNRTGIFVLHPIETTAGRPCHITHPDATAEKRNFPDHISPWQPFKNIGTMEWAPAGKGSARLDFFGEIFEMEDHRNWSDHSFKTYAPPLYQAIPELVQHFGDSIQHSVRLQVTHPGTRTVSSLPLCITMEPYCLPMSPVGIAMPDLPTTPDMTPLDALKNAGFSHFSISLPLIANWHQRLAATLDSCLDLDFPLELRAIFPGDDGDEWPALAELISSFPLLRSLCLLQQDRQVPDPDMLREICHSARETFPYIELGTGTEMHFAELNRWNAGQLLTDYISYPLHPQVHAFDNDTLVENLPAQQEMIRTARHRFPGKDVHVGPVSIKGPAYDHRYHTPFGAAWLLGSLKYLLEGGADSITYATPYPLMMEVFEKVLKEHPTYIRTTTCDQPRVVSSLIIGRGENITLLLANHTPLPRSVYLKDHPDAANLFDGRILSLEPYEIASITSTQSQPWPSVGG
jgi:hypothetical protein